MSFRARASLTIAILTALALGGAFAAVSAAFNGLQRQQLDASLRVVAQEEAAEAPHHAFAFSDRPGPAANDVGPLTKYGVIYDEQGKVLAATAPFEEHPPTRASLGHSLGDAFDLWQGSSHMRGVVVGISGHPGKRLFLATSRDDLDGDEVFLFRAMLTAFLVAVAWVAMVAYWMGGRLTRDHQAIASVVRGVAAGDLCARVTVHSSDPGIAQLARDINEMVARLAELMGSQQRFIAHAAHELRSPLAALYGELQQSLRRPRDADGYQSTINSALAATRRLTSLAEDLLALARIKADAAAGEPIEIERAIALASVSVGQQAQTRGVTILPEMKAFPCWIADRNGDTTRLLRNLLENAVRHSPPGGVVRVDVTQHQGTVRIVVSDSGAGIDDSERDNIFSPFFRGKGTSGTDGTGLGLGIAREIARSHGGDVALDDAHLPPGARFVISLPSRQAARQGSD